MNMLSQIKEIALQSRFTEAGYVDVTDLNYYPEVRTICQQNACRSYGTSWACPPAVGTIDACRERVNRYQKMLVFSRKYRLEDSFDLEGMAASMVDFKETVDLFQQNISGVLSDYLLLSNEGCGRCTQCTYPDAPCRFPQLLHHSLEGYGFIVSELAQAAGIRYNNGINTVTYFGALLINAD